MKVIPGVPESISCAKPRIALSGVRSSWLMLERKSDLARFACSATDLALSSSTFVSWSSCSLRLRSVTSRIALIEDLKPVGELLGSFETAHRDVRRLRRDRAFV